MSRSNLVLVWWVVLSPLCSFGSNICDDGKFAVKKDLGSEENWKCTGEKYPTTPLYFPAGEGYCNNTDYVDTSPLCMTTNLHYNHHPPSFGHYRPLAPRFGDYHYLPPQRWIHALKVGGVAFLYHPCTNQEQVELLKELARNCLSSYVLTPYLHLDEDKPLAVVTWGCVYQMQWVFPREIKEWLLKRDVHYSNEDSEKNDAIYEKGFIPQQETRRSFESLCPDVELTEVTKGVDVTSTQHVSDRIPCQSSKASSSSNSTNHLESSERCSHNIIHITLRQHSTGLVVLIALMCLVLMAGIILIFFKMLYSWKQKRPKYHRYKSVSKYFPFGHGKGTSDVIIPEVGLPKSGSAEREVLLNGSDEDEL